MNSSSPSRTIRSVYLAGGFRSGWQELVVQQLSSCFLIFDPRTNGLTDPLDFTEWDLDAIRKSDCMFAYMEPSNPGGFSLALEAGYAHALGKPIVLINDIDAQRRKYFVMVESIATHIAPNLGAAIEWLMTSTSPLPRSSLGS